MARRYKTPPFELEPLEEFYTLRRPEEVIDFLHKNPFLVPALVEAPEKVQVYFPGAELFLELFADPDSPTHTQLVIWIGTTFEGDEAIDRLHQLDEAWEIQLADKVTEKLSTNLGFR